MRNNTIRKQHALVTGLFILCTAPTAFSGTSVGIFPLDEYLKQVRSGNTGFQGAEQSAASGLERSAESKILTSPQLSFNATLASDSKAQVISSFTYDKITTNIYSLSLSQQTSFGLQAKLSYGVTWMNAANPAMITSLTAPPTSISLPATYYTTPSLELNFPLLGNGFGRTIRANQELMEAGALASSYGNRFAARSQLLEAEMTYWRLALARQTVSVQKDALERAKKIYEWNNRRASLHLADESDALQARALVEARELELEMADDELRSASVAFNSLRNIDSPVIGETLPEFSNGMGEAIQKMEAPARAPMRDDVRAAAESERITRANARIGAERNSMTLDVFASYALNGQNDTIGGSLGNVLPAGKPTQAVGIRLNMPLNQSASASSRNGWLAEQSAAEKTLQRKLFEQEIGWKTLHDKLHDAKKRLELALKLEVTQAKKLEHERDRLQRGRTVTYQVLMFEQDFAQSQLNRIRSQAEILTLVAQMKLYSEHL